MAGGNPDLGREPGEIDNGETEIDDGYVEEVLDDGEPEGEDGGATDGGADGGEDGQEPIDEAQGQARDVGRGRGRDTIRNLRQRAQQAERDLAAEREANNRRFAELEARIGQRGQPSAADLAREEAEEAARVELMSPAQVARYYAEKSERRIAQALQGHQFQTADRIDKQTFEAAAASNPLLQRIAPKVETLLASERAQGRNTDRMIVAKYLLGEEVLNRRTQQLPRQRAGAQRRVAGQTTRPTNGAGDGQRPGGRQGDDSYEAALRRARGVPL